MWKVLIVDDEYIMRQGLRYMIPWEERGYQIIGEATNGKEALELMESLTPDIIICDVVMPLLDGIDFVQIVHSIHPQIQIIALSGYDKFEYVKQTLINGASDYILKPVLSPELLLQALHNAASRLPEDLQQTFSSGIDVSRLLERYLLGHDSILNREVFSQQFRHHTFCLYAIDIKKHNSLGKSLHEILYKKIERETQQSQFFESLAVLLREEIACLLCCFSLEKESHVHHFLTELTSELTVITPELLAVCSRSFTQLEEVYRIFHQELSPCIALKFYYPTQKILFTAQLPSLENSKPLKFNFFKYSSYIENRQFEQALHLMDEYNQKALEQQTDVYRLKNQIKNVLYHFLDLLPLSDDHRDTLRYDFFCKIDGASNQEQYLTEFSQIAQLLRDLCDNAAPKDKRIEEIIAYIHENYQQELRLEDLAFRFNFNYSYLSAYFSSQMKESFSDYLNRVRIEHACRLLQNTQLTISEISKEVGYSEHSYFCRVFRKITGKTPSSWRRSE